MIHVGDCLEVMKTLDAESIDAIVTDPPYALTGASRGGSQRNAGTGPFGRHTLGTKPKGGFMGKEWDASLPSPEIWSEALRAAKPGTHLLAFGGTRTFHRLTVAIEDAGWEIRDCIMWVYGSGFTKGFNLNRVPQCDCISSGNMLPYDHEKRTESDTEHDVRSVPVGDLSQAIDNDPERGQVLQPQMQESGSSVEGWNELSRTEARRSEPGLEGRKVHRTGKGLCNGQNAESSTGTGKWLCSGTHCGDGIKDRATVDGHRGSPPYQPQSSGQQAGKPRVIREPQRPLDAGALRGRGQCSRCGKLKKEFAGFSTSLKPAWEPIIVARKPLAGTVAQNVQAYGTGAVNVDGCRVCGVVPKTVHGCSSRQGEVYGKYRDEPQESEPHPAGRWPANLIHDGSDEVTGLLSDAARFFYCAKASKADRDSGLDGWEETCRDKESSWAGECPECGCRMMLNGKPTCNHGKVKWVQGLPRRNHHPTVKPNALMRYLCRLVTPPGGVVLDPFCGSGSTGKAAVMEGFQFVGIELNPEYAAVAEARIQAEIDKAPLLEAVK